jgi:hypothetical protein
MTDTAVPPPAPAPAPQGEDTTVAILAYVTPLLCGIGIVIAILMHNSKKTKLGAYHLRQSLGMLVASIALWVAFMIVGFVFGHIPFLAMIAGILLMLLQFALGIGCLVLLVMGVMAASNRELKPLPVVGVYFEKWFGTAFD